MPTLKSTGTIYISNMSEDVWPFICAMSSSYAKEFEIQENARLSEHDLYSFFHFDNLLMILPRFPDKNYLDYYLKLAHNKNFSVLATKIHTGEICRDVLEDPDVLEEIQIFAKKYEKVHLVSYSASSQFLDLASYLQTRISNILLSEAPSLQDLWTVDFFGSKSGIRQLSWQSGVDEPDFRMTPGTISTDISNSVKIAANRYIKNGGIVIKTNKGHSGAGLLIFRPSELPADFPSCEKMMHKYLDKERYWKLFPIVIEKYIEPNFAIGGGYPNAEFRIHRSGKVEFLYYCACRLTRDGVFKGIEIHNEVLSDKVSAQIVDTGFFIGETYAKQGYRGYFDVDFITSKTGEIFVSESNTRRTGGTHVYYLAQALFGKDFMHEIYTISNNCYQIGKKLHLDSEKLFAKLSPVLYNKQTKKGLFITGTALLDQNAFGYVIFAPTKSKALTLEKTMEDLLKNP